MYLYVYFEDFAVYKYGVRLAARPPGGFRHLKMHLLGIFSHIYVYLCIFIDFVENWTSFSETKWPKYCACAQNLASRNSPADLADLPDLPDSG